MRINNFIKNNLYRRTGISYLLYPLSLLWLGLHRLKQARDRRSQYTAPVKVISIGNIVSGGGGKTPLTISIAKRLIRDGYQVGISHRGYKGEYEDHLKVVKASEGIRYSASALGDEAFMIATAVPDSPVAVGKDRKLACVTLLRIYPELDLIILDDSLQNHKVQHDLDVIAFSSEVGIGNGFVLPAGYLREPLSTIGKNSLVVINDKNGESRATETLATKVKRYSDRVFVAGSGFLGLFDRNGTKREVEEVCSHSVLLVSGIAAPESFEQTARRVGILWQKHFSYPDHHPYKDISEIRAWLKVNNEGQIVCTEKDFAKLISHEEISDRILRLKLELRLDREEEFYSSLRELLDQKTH